MYLGIDIGGTNIRSAAAALTDGPPTLVGRDSRRTPRTHQDDIVAALVASARAALAEAGATLKDLVAVTCAAPGPLDHRTGIVHQAPNLVGFVEFPLAERLSEALDGQPVFVDRDTAMAAVGESLAGAAVGKPDFVYVTVSTGVGGAIVSGGRMLRGPTGTSGEIGHWPVGLEGPPCRCGSFACVEAFAGGRNLAERYGVESARVVYEAASSGEARAAGLIHEAEVALGNLAIGLVNVLNPSVIMVGGAIAHHQPSHVIEPMRRAVAERAFRAPAAAVQIVPAVLGPDVGLIGGVLAARERVEGRADWFL